MHPCTSVLIALSIALLSSHAAQGQQDVRPDPRNYQNYELAKQNSRGKNMCPYLVSSTGKRIPVICWHCGFPSGMHTSSKYEYDCCPGYARSDLIDGKCAAMEPNWKTIPEYLKDKGHKETAQALSDNTNLPITQVSDDKVYTAFVPIKDGDIRTKDIDYTREPQAARMLVSGQRIYAYSLKNEQKIPNEAGGNMKVSVYSNGLIFVDCRMLVSVDHEATNGVVQFVDGALPPSNRYKSVMARLSAEPSVSQFTQALPGDVRRILSQENSAKLYTVFAPTNDAWSRIMSQTDRGTAAEELARNHVLPRMLCSSAVMQNTGKVGPTLSDEYFRMVATNQPDGPTLVDQCGKKINLVQKDLMSDGGVVHVIDQTMSSLKSMDLQNALKCLQQDSQGETSKAAREMLSCNVPRSTGSRMVVLLPTQKAYAGEVGQRVQSSDSGYRCNIYAHHILRPINAQAVEPGSRGLTQEEMFTTEYTAPDGSKPSVAATYIKDRYKSKLNFNGASAAALRPMEFKDGFIYPVDELNSLPEKSISRLIADESDTKRILEKLRATGIESTFKEFGGKFVFLAPIDMGWKTRDLENAYSNAQTKKLLQLHSIPHAIYGGQNGYLPTSTVQRVNSLLKSRDGSPVQLIIKRAPDGNTFIGHEGLPEKLWAMVLKWNKVGTDGMVWIVDWPIKCPADLC